MWHPASGRPNLGAHRTGAVLRDAGDRRQDQDVRLARRDDLPYPVHPGRLAHLARRSAPRAGAHLAPGAYPNDPRTGRRPTRNRAARRRSPDDAHRGAPPQVATDDENQEAAGSACP